MKKYRHIFFDLDRTLWDFDNNIQEAFHDLVRKHDLLPTVGSVKNFMGVYNKFNDFLWRDYRDGKLAKEVLRWKRFQLTLQHFGIENVMFSMIIGEDFLTLCQMKDRLLPDAHEVLQYLKENYYLHIITNGFEEVQLSKLENCNLNQYFTGIITSESVGVQKPDPWIFEYALEVTGAHKSESLMIGDDMEIDIKGAMNAGIDHVFINSTNCLHNESVTYEISSLIELKDIL